MFNASIFAKSVCTQEMLVWRVKSISLLELNITKKTGREKINNGDVVVVVINVLSPLKTTITSQQTLAIIV